MRAVPFRRVCALCASLLSLIVLPATAMATATQGEVDTAIGKAVAYIRDWQVAETGEPGDPESGIAFDKHSRFSNDWVAGALAAAGVSSADVFAEVPGSPPQPGPSFQDFLLGEYRGNGGFWGGSPPSWLPEIYERPTMAAYSAGLDSARLSAAVNLPAQVAGSWNPATGGFGDPSPQDAYYTAFGLLALKRTPAPAWALAPAAEHLRELQESDGSWGEELITTSDMTASSVAALCEAGIPAYDPAVASALSYLKLHQTPATGAVEPGNAESTASLISALTTCGIDAQSPRWTTSAGKTPVDYLISLQAGSGQGTGGFAYEPGEPTNLYSTAFALRAIAGGGFTPAPPARENPALPSVRPAPTVAAGTPVPHLLAIRLAPGNVRMCEVTAPAGGPLTQVLGAAKATAYPTGCVSSFSVDGGQVTSVDGVAPANQDQAWLLRLDRGAEALAGEQPVGFGDVIALRLGAPPRSPQEPAGSPGPAGKAGAPGPRGKRGAKGKAGRNAEITCMLHSRRSGKHRVRCTVKHQHRGDQDRR